jgi:hypothetical protein
LQEYLNRFLQVHANVHSWIYRTKGWIETCKFNDHGYVLLVVSTSGFFPHPWLVTRFVTRLTRRVPLMEQKLLTLPEHLSSSPMFSGVRVTRSLVLCVCFVDHSLSFSFFYFGNCVVCSLIYLFWFPLWYLQTLPKDDRQNIATLQMVIILSKQSLNILKGYSEAYNLHPPPTPNKRKRDKPQKTKNGGQIAAELRKTWATKNTITIGSEPWSSGRLSTMLLVWIQMSTVIIPKTIVLLLSTDTLYTIIRIAGVPRYSSTKMKC